MNRSRKMLLTAACCLLVSRPAWSEEVVRTIRWQELAAVQALTSGTVVPASGSEASALRLAHAGSGGATFPLLTIERPGITRARYALRGRLRYEGVAATSYLEMWSHLSGGAFFSRSLDRSGPMGRLEGSSNWRTFVLPFFNREGGAPPDKLVLNLVMGGAGTVEIGPIEIVQFTNDEDLFADATAWWSDRQAGLLGGIAGSVLGIFGGFIGWLGSAGRARGFILATLKVIAFTGLGAVVTGALALWSGQPYGVYYPLLLVGAISATLGFSLPRSLRKRYEELELRRMQALDA